MDNLKDYSEITDLNFDGENPHLAICHKSQGYSANKRPTALLFKSEGVSLNQDIMKSLDGVVKQEIIQKMSYENKRKALQEAIEQKLRADMSANGEYFCTYVMDFNEDLVAFRYHSFSFSVSSIARFRDGDSASLLGDCDLAACARLCFSKIAASPLTVFGAKKDVRDCCFFSVDFGVGAIVRAGPNEC